MKAIPRLIQIESHDDILFGLDSQGRVWYIYDGQWQCSQITFNLRSIPDEQSTYLDELNETR